MTLKTRKDNRTGYNEWAAFYDGYINPTVAIDGMTFPALRSGISGKTVLDIGCGTGRHTARLLAQGNRVVGIDLSEGMLEKAKSKFADAGAEFIRTTVADFHPAQKFGAAICSLVLEHIEDLPSFFAKVAALVETEGEFFLSDLHPSRSAQGIGAHFKTPDATSEVHLVTYSHDRAAIQSAAEQNGWKVVGVDDVEGGEALTAQNPAWAKYAGKPLIHLWQFKRG